MARSRPPCFGHVRRGHRQEVSPTLEQHTPEGRAPRSTAEVPIEVLDQLKMTDFNRLSQVVALHRIGPLQRALVQARLHPGVHGVRFSVPRQEHVWQGEQMLDDTMVGFDGRVGPVHAGRRIGREQDEQADRVCTVLLDHRLGRDRVAQ